MTKRRFGKTAIGFLLAAAVLLSMVQFVMPTQVEAKTSAEWKEELDDLKEKNKELQGQVQALESQRKQNLSELKELVAEKDAIDQQVALLYEQIENINAQIAAYNLLIADKQDELDMAEGYLAELNRQNRERIRAMEAEGSVSFWSVIFKASSFSDLLDRLNMVRQIAEADRARIEEMNRVAAQVAQTQAELTAQKAEMEQTRVDMDAAKADLDVRRAQADAVLAELAARGEEFDELIAQGEDKVEELMADIAKADKEYNDAKKKEEEAAKPKPGGQGGTPNPGGWVVPCSYSRVTSPFSSGRMHPVLGYVRPHNGIDLGAPSGTPIYATRSGTVTRAAYQEGGAGNYVSISHGDGFGSIYMHMTRYVVSVGQQVSAGQLIGYVGSTGVSNGPHLHFGISYNGTYVNPANYINF